MLMMLLPGAVTFGWMLWKNGHASYPFALEPIYAGLTASLLVWAAARALNSRAANLPAGAS
jgi:hypothetical protein